MLGATGTKVLQPFCFVGPWHFISLGVWIRQGKLKGSYEYTTIPGNAKPQINLSANLVVSAMAGYNHRCTNMSLKKRNIDNDGNAGML